MLSVSYRLCFPRLFSPVSGFTFPCPLVSSPFQFSCMVSLWRSYIACTYTQVVLARSSLQHFSLGDLVYARFPNWLTFCFQCLQYAYLRTFSSNIALPRCTHLIQCPLLFDRNSNKLMCTRRRIAIQGRCVTACSKLGPPWLGLSLQRGDEGRGCSEGACAAERAAALVG